MMILSVLLLPLINSCTGALLKPEILRSAACLEGEQKTLELQCPRSHKIRVMTVRYGRAEHKCTLNEDDCQFSVAEPEYVSQCTGQTSCITSLPDERPSLPHCDGITNVFAVDYICVPESEIFDICGEETELYATSGYIETPRYPVNYPASLRCAVKIQMTHDHGLRLIVVDMEVAKGKTSDCDDFLYAADGVRSVSICSRHVLHDMFNTDSSSITVQFQSNAAITGKGFLLYWEAIKKPTSPTTPTTTTRPVRVADTTTRLATSRLTSSTAVTSPALKPDVSEPQEEVPVAAIVGGVLGSLGAVSLVLVVLLVLRTCRGPRTSKSAGKSNQILGNNQLLSKGYLDNLRTGSGPAPIKEFEPWEKPVQNYV